MYLKLYILNNNVLKRLILALKLKKDRYIHTHNIFLLALILQKSEQQQIIHSFREKVIYKVT